MKNAEDKNVNARNYVDNLHARYGDKKCTQCLIYNATGDNLTLVGKHDWQGFIWQSPYPATIGNGQWGAFLHIHQAAMVPIGSVGAVVYRGKNDDGEERDWMLAWNNTVYLWEDNKVYTEVREAHHYENVNWKNLLNKMEKNGLEHIDKWDGCCTYVSTGTGNFPVFEGTTTLQGVV